MKLVLFLCGSMLLPVHGQNLSIAPTTPTVQQQGTMQFTANRAVTWSLVPGSAGSIDSNGVYTAPSTVEVKQRVGPCQLLPPDHIYNTRIDGLPVHPSSDTIVTRGGTGFRIEFQASLPINLMASSTSTFDASFLYTPANNGPFQILPWPELKMQSGVFTGAFSGEDRHVHAVNRDTCEFSDLYNKYPAGTNPTCPKCTSQSGAKYSSDHTLPTTGATDAAGMEIQPVTLRLSDIQSGAIQHAMRFTMSNSHIKPSFVWPATTNAFPYCSGTCWEYGMYARLKSSYDVSGFSPAAQIILNALKQYGMIMTDGGTNWAVTASTDLALDKDARAAIREIFNSALRNSHFEVVDTSSLKMANGNGAVKLGTEYVTPSQFAEVIATDSNGVTAATRVNLQGVVVGTAEPTMTIMAGHTVTPAAWVNGTATQTVIWSMSPSVGTLNEGTGEYTAPTGVNAPMRTRLTATSTVEPTAQAHIDVVIWPDNAGGNIYADWGRGDTVAKTHEGKTFWPDEWTQAEGWNGIVGEVTSGGTIFTNVRYFYHDTMAKWYLPNGNYKARVYVKSSASGTISPNAYQIHYESQGRSIYRNYSLGRATQGQHGVGGYVDLPMQVTDGSGTLAFRHLSVTGSNVYIAAIGIEADSSEPYLAIDDAGVQGRDVTFSQTRQFHAIGWYMPDSVTWEVTSGPGTIDENGLYRAPSAPPASPQTVTIRATSTADPAKWAEASFQFIFGVIEVTPQTMSLARGLTQQFSASIGGIPYENITWLVEPALGSIGVNGLYLAPVSLGQDTPITIRAISLDDPSVSGTASMTVLRLIKPIRINCGGQGFTDAQGRVWAADSGFSTPSVVYSGGVVIQNTTPDMYALYRSSRYRYRNETFTYRFPVPVGNYKVTLKWAEYRTVDEGMRMDVKIEDATVVTNFNPVSAAGGLNIAIDRSFSALVTDGEITLTFIGRPDAGYLGAAISGIEIVEETPTGSASVRGTTVLRAAKLQ